MVSDDDSFGQPINHTNHRMPSKLLRSQELLNMSFTPTTPSLHDVLCGTGHDRANHPGNDLFRRIASQYVDRYSNATAKKEKMRLTKCILDDLNASGVRFLKKHPVQLQWYVADQKVARDKIGHFLRDNMRKAPSPEEPFSSVTATSPSPAPNMFRSAPSRVGSNFAEPVPAGNQLSHHPPDSPLAMFLLQQQGNYDLSITNYDKKQQEVQNHSSVWNKGKTEEAYDDNSYKKMEEDGKSSFGAYPYHLQQQFHQQQQQFRQPPPNMEIQAGIRDLILRTVPSSESSNAGKLPAPFQNTNSGGSARADPRMISRYLLTSLGQKSSSSSCSSTGSFFGKKVPESAGKRGSSSSCSSGGSAFGKQIGFDLISPVMTSCNMDIDYDSDDDTSLFDDTELAERLD